MYIKTRKGRNRERKRERDRETERKVYGKKWFVK
jgi:hypothetical protein